MEKVLSTPPRIPRQAIKCSIDRLITYAKAHTDDKQPIRCWLRDAVVALERDDFRLVHLGVDRRHGRRAP